MQCHNSGFSVMWQSGDIFGIPYLTCDDHVMIMWWLCWSCDRRVMVMWCIAGNFEGENFRELVKNTIFTEKTFTDCSLLPRRKTASPQNFAEKLSQIATKLWNSQKFFPSKVFRYTVYIMWWSCDGHVIFMWWCVAAQLASLGSHSLSKKRASACENAPIAK